MFEEIDFYPEEALGVLCIEKLLYDHLGIVTDSSIDADYLYACMEDAIFEIVQDVWYKYSEIMQMNIAHILDVQPGRYGVVQLFKVGPGVLHVPQPRPVEHGGFGNLRQHLLLALSIQKKTD